MRLDICEFPVRKTGRFTHVSGILGHDVSEKRFNTHVSSKLSRLVCGKRFISHGRRNWGVKDYRG